MLEDATVILKFWKGGIGEFKKFLPHIFLLGAYHAPCHKGLCNIKHGFQGWISKLIWTVLDKQPIYV